MKPPENIHSPVTEFMRKTGCDPLFMASLTLDQVKNHFWEELPEELANEVAAKAETVFAGNARWRKKFQGRRGREYLVMFMRHWLSAALFKRKSPLFRQLPEDFKVGRPLPAISLPRQLEQSPKRMVRRKFVARRPSHFVHGCEHLPL